VDTDGPAGGGRLQQFRREQQPLGEAHVPHRRRLAPHLAAVRASDPVVVARRPGGGSPADSRL